MASSHVYYDYEDGWANTIRPTSVTYPDGRVLTYDYGSSGGMNDKLSRAESLGFGGTSNLVQPAYLGLGTQVRTSYSEPDVRWDLATGTSPNPYAGLDRFGRVIDNKWTNYSTNTTLDQIKYTYDRASNRTSRENVVAKAQTTPKYFDELYGYDGSNRLSLMERGQLAGSPPSSITNKQFAQDWGLDPTGNWKVFKEDDNGDGTWDLNQTRTSNPVNEITAINETAGPSWITPGYDGAGNMTTIPRPAEPTGDFTGIYDAWNRLVELRGLDDTVVGRYEYDGLTRRVVKHTFPGWEELEAADWDAMTQEDWNGLQLTQAHRRDYYYNSSWQTLEERVENDTVFDRQYVWGLQYIDGLVFRDRQSASSVQRNYVLQDANWNVTALTDDSGAVVERYNYSAYGVPAFLNPDFTTAANNEAYDWDVLYAGYKWDSESALYQVRYRYLQPAIGTWVTRDPIGYLGRDVNLFGYASRNALVRVDPYGNADAPPVIKGPFYAEGGLDGKKTVFDAWTKVEIDEKQKPIAECCNDNGITRKSKNCIRIVIWSPGREENMSVGHASFGISSDTEKKVLYGFHGAGFMDDDIDMKGYHMHSDWQCCCYSDEEMQGIEKKYGDVKKRADVPVKDRTQATQKQDLEGGEYSLNVLWGAPYHHCAGTAATFAAGLGCPNLLEKQGIWPANLLEALRANKFCRIKAKGDWANYDKQQNPPIAK